MFNSNNVPFMMNVEPAGSNNANDGFGYGGGWFIWFIIIILLLWGNNGWGGYGNGGNSGAADNYVLASDFATIQRQLSDGFGTIERKGDTINAGLCDGFYAQNTTLLNGFNGVNSAITQATIGNMQNTNALTAQITGLGNQLASCCCDQRYETASKFADLNYNIATQDCQTRQTVNDIGRSINDVQNENTRAVLAAIQSIKDEAKDNKIQELTAQVNALNLAASQQAQNNYLVDQLAPKAPQPAFVVPAPWQISGCGCNCNTGCGC